MLFINQKVNRTFVYVSLVTMLFFLLPLGVMADKIEGKMVVTLGENLTEAQKTQLLNQMGVDEDVEILYVSNAEEHQYLGNYMSKSDIGTRALSSVKITLTSEGSGINVQTNNVSITPEMYTNALVTAGVQDADVYVTAPIHVSGTAALTGILKAFEAAIDGDISEEQKQVANEEIVRTKELAERIGAEEAAELLMRLKDALGEQELNTDEDYRQFILNIAAELNIQLSDEDVDALVHLLKRIKGLNINWDQAGKQLKNIRDNLGDILNREETQSIIQMILDFLIGLVEKIKNLFA